MSNSETVQSVLAPQVSLDPPTVSLPTEAQLQKAYHELRRTIHLRLKQGLEFGRMCYQLQLLDRLNIKKTTAYRWIRKYKKRELSATWHEVKKKSKANKRASDGQSVQLEFDLPAHYERKQWDDDVKVLGGYKKVMRVFVDEFLPELHKRAEAKRTMKPSSRSVH